MNPRDLTRLWVLAEALATDPAAATLYLGRTRRTASALAPALDAARAALDGVKPSASAPEVAARLTAEGGPARLLGDMLATVIERRGDV